MREGWKTPERDDHKNRRAHYAWWLRTIGQTIQQTAKIMHCSERSVRNYYKEFLRQIRERRGQQ